MGEGGLGGGARQQARHFGHALVALHRGQNRFGRVARGFRHGVVGIGEHSHLGQMRDGDDLVAFRQLRQHGGERIGGASAHAGVHLVEDKGLRAVLCAQSHLDGQHDAADFASGGDAGQGARLHGGAGLELEDDACAARGAPAFAGQRLHRAHERRRPHLQASEHLVDRRREPRRGLDAGCIIGGRRFGEGAFGRFHGRLGAGQVLVGVVDEPDEGRRLVPALEDGLHGGTEGAHEPHELPHALLGRGQRLAVEIDGVAVAGHIPGDVLHDEADFPQRRGEGGQRLVGPGGLLDEGDGRVQGVQRAAVAGERLGGPVGVAGEHLGVLGPGEPVARFLVLAALGVHRLYLLQREAGLLQLRVGGARRCPHLFQGRLGGTGIGEGLAKGRPYGAFQIGPTIEDAAVLRRLQQRLVLVLSAELHQRPHRARELRDAGHGAVYGGAAAAVGADLAHRDELFGGGIGREQAPPHFGVFCPLAHAGAVGALADEQFHGAHERRLSRTRLAG